MRLRELDEMAVLFHSGQRFWCKMPIELWAEAVYTAYNDEGNKRQVFANYQAAKPGDRFVGYHSYPEMRVVCTGAVMSGLDESLPPLEQGVAIGEKVKAKTRLAHAEMVDDPVLGSMDHLKKGRTGSLFAITTEQFERIVELIGR